jgi:hypothetical protein
MLPVSILLCLVLIVNRVCLYVSCVQCCPYLSFCVLCSMLPMSIFLCLVSNVTHIYLSISCDQCYPFLSFCVLCPMLPVSILLCLVSNVTRVYLSVYCVQSYTLHKTQKYKHGQHWTQETERETRVTLDTRNTKIDTVIIGLKTQKDRHG